MTMWPPDIGSKATQNYIKASGSQAGDGEHGFFSSLSQEMTLEPWKLQLGGTAATSRTNKSNHGHQKADGPCTPNDARASTNQQSFLATGSLPRSCRKGGNGGVLLAQPPPLPPESELGQNFTSRQTIQRGISNLTATKRRQSVP